MNESDRLLASIREELTSRKQLTKKTLAAAMNSSDLGVNCEVLHHLLETQIPQKRVSLTDCSDFIQSTLERCFRGEGMRGIAFSEFEAGQYLGRFFLLVWRNKTYKHHLKEFRTWLETFLRQANVREKDVVLLGFLEHALCDPKIDRFFAHWEQDKKLAGVLSEGRFLAKGFLDLDRRGSPKRN